MLDPQHPSAWTDWESLPAAGGKLASPGPFVQLEVELATDDPRVSPTLKAVQITAEPAVRQPWVEKYQLVGEHRPQIVRSAVPFRYEPFDRPELRELREKFGSDKVVAAPRRNGS